MTVLVVNCGSSSVKYQLIEFEEQGVQIDTFKGVVEKIGSVVPNHSVALENVAQEVKSYLDKGGKQLSAIGHRVVHGGAQFSNPTVITDDVIDTIDRLSVLAPLHNPANIEGIRAAKASFPCIPQVAVFDTAFHATIPKEHSTYAVPANWETDHGVRRYGFHGTSHKFVSQKCIEWLAQYRQIEPAQSRVVVLHLGNGASACAVKGGKSIDTSMGLTPLPGLVMGTRSGDVDPAIFGHLQRVADMTIDEIDTALNRESGLKGLSGASDMREIERRIANGDEQAELAMRIYIHRIKSYIGAYTVTLGGLDALVFTAGVGENSALVRERVAAGLSGLGISLDEGKNRNLSSQQDGINEISSQSSEAALLVIPTNEELEIAKQTLEALS